MSPSRLEPATLRSTLASDSSRVWFISNFWHNEGEEPLTSNLGYLRVRGRVVGLLELVLTSIMFKVEPDFFEKGRRRTENRTRVQFGKTDGLGVNQQAQGLAFRPSDFRWARIL